MNAEQLDVFVREMECETAAEAARALHERVSAMTGVLSAVEMLTDEPDADNLAVRLADLNGIVKDALGSGRRLFCATSTLVLAFEKGAR